MNINSLIKQTIKLLVPNFLLSKILLRKTKIAFSKQLKVAYVYDMKRYMKNIYSFDLEYTETNLIGLIIREYHVIEKGLTMPNTRLGFGKDVLIDLIKNCIKFASKFSKANEQLLHAVGVIKEYEYFHLERNYILSEEISKLIIRLSDEINNVNVVRQKDMTISDYFAYNNESFPIFSSSRSSVRNYSDEDINIDIITEAINLSRNTPSACNRQPWRTYVFSDKAKINSILETQAGNRGFGHLTNKLIVITSELGMYSSIGERNGAYVDGGMYAMNLLYFLHYKKIAACILNCSNTLEKDVKLRELCGIKDSEVFIAMITCGIPPEKFKIANSFRTSIIYTNKNI